MLSFRKGVLSLHGRAIARVEPADNEPATRYALENIMRGATRLYNAAHHKKRPAYFRPDTTVESRYYHGGMAALIALLLCGGIYSGTWPGFFAFALLALAAHWAQPSR